MPNWCANSLRLTTKTEEHVALIIKIIVAIKDAQKKDENPRIFNIIKPMPDELREVTKGYFADDAERAENDKKRAECAEKYGYTDWYDWSLGEWGTKWDASDVFHTVEPDGSLLLTFDTAWSPPIELYKTLEDMGFKVSAGFVEQGVNYIGYYVDGVDHTEEITYESNPEEDEDEDEYNDPFDLSEFFSTKYGMNHAPTHFGG